MASQQPDHETGFIATSQAHREILIPFQQHFDITWARDRTAHNTRTTVFLLKPKIEISQTFGLENEVPLFVFPFQSLQPRSIQAIDAICSDSPLAGRVDPTVVFLYAPDPKIVEWTTGYQAENPQSRILVPFSAKTIRAAIDDNWQIRNNIKDQLFIRDLFDYKLPLKNDLFFYGRDEIVASIIDNIKKRQNTGVFGLRKTGKTSVLLKSIRLANRDKNTHTVFLDCKSRPIRSRTCDELINEINQRLAPISKRPHTPKQGEDPIIAFEKTVDGIPRGNRVCIFFDEIEYISPISPMNPHWASDFIDFWQSLWSIQTQSDKICYVVCGVNPTVCDVDRFPSPQVQNRTVQNPMFGIFNTFYLKGFELPSLTNMVQFFGSRMGLSFDQDAIEYLHSQYGGHPLLVRLACSYHHQKLINEQAERPAKISVELLKTTKDQRNSELRSYCEHVVSEIRELYPDEYEVLTMLAAGNIADAYEFAGEQSFVKHIIDYGLISDSKSGPPKFLIPVVRDYLQIQMKTSKGGNGLHVVPVEDRVFWIQRRRKTLVGDFCFLNAALRDAKRPELFPGAAPAKVDDLMDLGVVNSEMDIRDFLVKMNVVFVENIETNLKKRKQKFFDGFCLDFEILGDALARIKIYRHYFCHIELDEKPKKRFETFLETDFDGRLPGAIDDGWFKLQYVIVEHLHVALQHELSRL